jgi:hypothetical protein
MFSEVEKMNTDILFLFLLLKVVIYGFGLFLILRRFMRRVWKKRLDVIDNVNLLLCSFTLVASILIAYFGYKLKNSELVNYALAGFAICVFALYVIKERR